MVREVVVVETRTCKGVGDSALEVVETYTCKLGLVGEETCACKGAWVVMVVEVVETYTCKLGLVGVETCTYKGAWVVMVGVVVGTYTCKLELEGEETCICMGVLVEVGETCTCKPGEEEEETCTYKVVEDNALVEEETYTYKLELVVEEIGTCKASWVVVVEMSKGSLQWFLKAS